MKRVAILAALALGALAVVALALVGGAYDVSATRQHWAPTYWLLDVGMRASVKARAKAIAVPDLNDTAKRERGLALFRRHCVHCHGAPGVAPEPFALGMTPTPANLVHTARDWPAAEVYWVVREGLKMTGMPAWRYRMADDDLWAIVAFMQALPTLSPQEYRALVARDVEAREPAPAEPDADRGRQALAQYACATCHVIPGIVGANAPVGPPLAGIASRAIIAGRLPNTPDAMVRWLRAPHSERPLGAMPDLGVGERDARDIAAYLATLR